MQHPNWAAFIVAFPLCLFLLWCLGKIFRKAGYSGWLALLYLVPLANLILFIWFALSEWPIERQLRDARTQLKL